MLNQIVLVGRISKFETKEESTIMTIVVPRAFKKVTFLSTKNTRKEEE